MEDFIISKELEGAKDNVVTTIESKKKSRKNTHCSKPSDLKMDDIQSTIYGRGLDLEDVKSIINHLLDLPLHPSTTKTRHKNFIRAMIHLVIFIHYSNDMKNFYCQDMTNKDTGYIHEFENNLPYKKDLEYKKFFDDIFNEMTSKRLTYSYQPSLDEIGKWAGNMYNYVCTVMRNAYDEFGVVPQRETEKHPGICKDWNKFLLSMDIDLKALCSLKK